MHLSPRRMRSGRLCTSAGIMDNGIQIEGCMDAKGCRAPVCTSRCTLLVVAALICASSAWAAASLISFNLQADECPKALIEFSHQANVEVIFRTDSLPSIRTQPVIGEFTPAQALDVAGYGAHLRVRFRA